MLLLAAMLAQGAAAAPLVVSPAPEAVAVTVYRDPQRGADARFDLRWLRGFALVTETRTVSLPAGASELRFEGVAEGIVPVSAIVTGLPGGVIEKNRDARLLSPAALIDARLGQRVTLRRTSRATGAVREEEAVIRSGPAGGVLIETADGIEALGCAGLAETLRHAGVPAGLAARPTLAVTTRSPRAATATLRLSYLASAFDWSASYVARVAPNGRTLDLFAWATLANGNGESFADAETQAVAGTLNRETPNRVALTRAPRLRLQCWPLDGTSTVAEPMEKDEIVVTGAALASRTAEALPLPPPPPPPPAPAMIAEQEELGALKLYRVPERVTIAAKSQKQVALLDRRAVPFTRLYQTRVAADQARTTGLRPTLRLRNTEAKGLGLPLPAGTVAVFGRDGARELMLGESILDDVAVGQEAEIGLAPSSAVAVTITRGADGRHEAMVTNALPDPVSFEVSLIPARADERIAGASRKLVMRDGRQLWAATVPANGRAVLRYRYDGRR